MKFIGGPKDGEELFLDSGTEKPVGEVAVTSTWFSDENQQMAVERHLYTPDAFGNLKHVRRIG